MDSIQTQTKIPKVNTKGLLLKVISGKGVIITACGMAKPTGCFDFATTLYDQYPHLDHAEVVGESITRNGKGRLLEKITEKLAAWDFAIITGCDLNGSLKNFMTLENDIRFKGIKEVFYLVPPHQVHASLEEKDEEYIKSAFSRTTLKVVIVFCNLSSQCHHLGLPIPIPDLVVSKYKLPKNCYGLMYNNLATKTGLTDRFLFNYFKNVLEACPRGAQNFVYAINMISLSNHLEKIATKFNIKIQHISRLHQNDFIKAMLDLKRKGGLIACDGVQTLMQAAFLQTPFMFYVNFNSNHNWFFVKNLMDHTPPHLHDAAEDILGINQSGSLAHRSTAFREAQIELSKLVKKSIFYFINNQSPGSSNSAYVIGEDVIVRYNIITSLSYVEALISCINRPMHHQELIKRHMSSTRVSLSLPWLKQIKQHNSKGISELEHSFDLKDGTIFKLV